MTQAQWRVYHCVVSYLDMHGYPPTVREVQAILGYGSTATPQHHIKALVAQGYLQGTGRRLRVGEREPITYH